MRETVASFVGGAASGGLHQQDAQVFMAHSGMWRKGRPCAYPVIMFDLYVTLTLSAEHHRDCFQLLPKGNAQSLQLRSSPRALVVQTLSHLFEITLLEFAAARKQEESVTSHLVD